MSLWLSAAEVEELTAKKRWSAQRRALVKMGVAFTLNAVGRPLVSRGLWESSGKPARKRQEPDWDAIHAKAA